MGFGGEISSLQLGESSMQPCSKFHSDGRGASKFIVPKVDPFKIGSSVVVSTIFLFLSPLFGEDEPNLTNSFQRGWFNHQVDFTKSLFFFQVGGWFNHQLGPGEANGMYVFLLGDVLHPSFLPWVEFWGGGSIFLVMVSSFPEVCLGNVLDR